MAIRCGFFNSVDEDRLYSADDMNKPYELLVSNGVFATQQGTPSNYLQVYSESGLTVRIKAGRGIFFDKWFLSDSDLVLSIDPAEPTLSRIDSIVVRVDKTEDVRGASIIVKKGTPNSTPQPPALTRTDYVMEYRLANITLAPSVVSISQANIQDTRGLSECGWVTSLIQQLDTSTLYEQWQTGFDEWFRTVKETLSTATLIRSYNSVYTTVVQDETLIPIDISQFVDGLDIIQVYINGLMLIRDVEYSVAMDSQTITLTKGVDVGTPISFVVYKSIDGSEAETVVSQVVELQNNLDKVRLTSMTGAVKRAIFSGDLLATFRTMGVGMHTILASDAVTNTPIAGQYWRCFGHYTDAPYGWLIAVSGQGKAYINFASGESSWTGWRELTNTQSPVAENGAVKISVTGTDNVLTAFTNAGVGFHTMYAAYNTTGLPMLGAYRLFGHLTAANFGWLIAIKADGSTYTNYLDNGVWQGWKVLSDALPAPLYKSDAGVFPNAGATITPSKPLSQCQHGWQLVFSGYNDSTSTARDLYVQTFNIPKRSYKDANWNGESVTIPLAYQYVNESDETRFCQKTMTVYDNRLVAGSTSSTGKQRNMVLRAVYEY